MIVSIVITIIVIILIILALIGHFWCGKPTDKKSYDGNKSMNPNDDGNINPNDDGYINGNKNVNPNSNGPVNSNEYTNQNNINKDNVYISIIDRTSGCILKQLR